MRNVLIAILFAMGAVSGAMPSAVADDAKAVEKPQEVAPVLLQMMRNDAIHDHLDLDPTTRKSIHATLDTIDGPWWRSRLLGDEERKATVAKLTETLRTALREQLSAKQMKRVSELETQALLTEADRAKIEKMSRQEVLATYGQPFDFAAVTRTFPRAPELITGTPGTAKSGDTKSGNTKSNNSTTGNWVHGNAGSLADLRGKVVAVHFYAFQCNNCVRNLPHYKSWHEELADKGLVVIGIQTPETSRERDVEAVRKAAKESAIEYPVLMDPTADNWKAWGNTMWPTVYLIDKDGYIRAWWQGELNWEGATGEQTMRENIMKLLAE